MKQRVKINPNVSISNGHLIKKGLLSDLRVEAEKMQVAREIGIQTGLFKVPRLLKLDTEN